MQRAEAELARQEGRPPRRRLESDYLLRVHDQQRMGGLRLKESLDGEFVASTEGNEVPPWMAMQYLSCKGDNVLDLFCGSGSTLIGAAQTGRRAFLMELDPPYCDVIFDRYQRFTGKAAVLERTGESPVPVGAREENMG